MTSLETGETVPSLQLGIPAMSTIMILDDDHGGVFCFEEHEAEITESVGTFELKVFRGLTKFWGHSSVWPRVLLVVEDFKFQISEG